MALVDPIQPTSEVNNLISGLEFQAVPNAVVRLNAAAPRILPVVNLAVNPPSGYDVARLIFNRMPLTPPPAEYPEPDVPVSDAAEMTKLGTSAIGTPIYANIEFQGENWTDFNGRSRSFPAMSFDTVLLNVTQTKNIIETEIQGSDYGAVLEYSGLRNYDIQCDITITGANGVYPQEAVSNLLLMLNAPVAIRVNSWYLQNLDIFSLTVRDYNMPQIQGGISQQKVSISFSSNNSAILVIQ